MTLEHVEQAHTRVPFKPFVLCLDDQRKIVIRHPEFLWIMPDGFCVAVADERGVIEVIDLDHVTSLRMPDGTNELRFAP